MKSGFTFMQWKLKQKSKNFNYFDHLKTDNNKEKLELANFGDDRSPSFISYDSTSKIFSQQTNSFKEFQSKEKEKLKLEVPRESDQEQAFDRASYFQWKASIGI